MPRRKHRRNSAPSARDQQLGTREPLTYEHVDQALIREMPEIAAPYQRLRDDWGDGHPGQYLVLEGIFGTFIHQGPAHPPGQPGSGSASQARRFVPRFSVRSGARWVDRRVASVGAKGT